MVITDFLCVCVCNVFRKLSPALDDIINLISSVKWHIID